MYFVSQPALLTFAGVTAWAYSKKEALIEFKEAQRLTIEDNPDYKFPKKPSSKSIAKDRLKAAIDRCQALGGEEITGSLELLQC